MFAKLFHRDHHSHQKIVNVKDFEPRVAVHYGIPSTASILAFDPIQQLLAIGTLDGRIKVIGGDNIEGIFISSKSLPFKNLEFLQNQGFLVSISNENVVQVWDLENRRLASSLQWESNISAFSVIYGTHYMYVGDEYGFLSVLKYDAEEGSLVHLPYHLPANLISDEAGVQIPDNHSVVGLLPQPCSSAKRVLIAYDNGLIILWDVSEDQAVLVKGYKDLQLKDKRVVLSPSDVRHEHLSDDSDEEQADKEISSLCWASSDGSVLAVGYVDGDILLWDLSTDASPKDQRSKKTNNAIKLQLSSGERRLPVIVLHWYANSEHNDCGGQLFVYGGDAIGSEEVLTILTLDWSSGIVALKCINRVDLTLHGSYADMILVPNAGSVESISPLLFVLTNPGQLHFYDNACLSTLLSHPERKHSVDAVQYPMLLPTIEPYMTVGKLSWVIEKEVSRTLKEAVSAFRSHLSSHSSSESTKWPLTGGVPSQLSLAESNGIERLYIAGYQDGFIRIWDATFPVLSLMFVFESQVEGIEIPGMSAPISALDFSSSASSLAVGTECGLVRLHKVCGNTDETTLHLVKTSKHEVISLLNGNRGQCTAVFSLLTSPVRSLQYIAGSRLAVGFECGQVALLDVCASSVLFLTDCLVSSSSWIVSVSVRTYLVADSNVTDHLESTLKESTKEIAIILTKDTYVVLIDSISGNTICSQLMKPEEDSTAISMYILEENVFAPEMSEKKLPTSSQESEVGMDSVHSNLKHDSDLAEVKIGIPNHSGQTFLDSHILLCCEHSLLLFSSKSLLQGKIDFEQKINLAKPCCWTSIFKKDGKDSGLILVYQTGAIEIRSLPDLEVIGETSIMSLLRWSFKTNMEKMIGSSSNGLIAMVNGCEFSFISLLAFENDLRIPEALPCLHDKAVAAVADVYFDKYHMQKKRQSSTPRIFGGIIKGLKVGKADQTVSLNENRESFIANLERMFSRFPFSVSSIDIGDEQEDVTINLDDIEIDVVPISSSPIKKVDRKDKEKERERLFDGGSTEAPKLRTAEEIRAKYRKTGDASSAAAQAKDKLMERQEKLERLSLRTQELQDGAENFASLATQLAKKMENKKWWQL